MFKGFFDESNRNPVEVKFIMAGWIAQVEEWERFSEAWYECLTQKPAINYFKVHEADQLDGQFYKLTSDDAAEKKLALASVISQYDIRGYVVTAAHEILANKPERLNKLMGTRIYDWALIAMVSSVLEDYLACGKSSEVIDFVFDGCGELRACIESYEKIRDKFTPAMRKISGEVIPGNDKKLVGLQAADLLAGEFSAFLKTGTRGVPYRAFMIRPIMEIQATPPPAIAQFLQYAQEVYQRREVVSEAIKMLKENGINLDDFK